MKYKTIFSLLTAVYLATLLPAFGQEHKSPPVTRVDNVTETLHGVTITDPYRWLEDQNSPETRAWIKAQNEYTSSVLGVLPFRNKIRERLTQLLKVDTINTPIAKGGRYFISKRRADQNQAVIHVRIWM
jgi:prolyl oligopeptidase